MPARLLAGILLLISFEPLLALDGLHRRIHGERMLARCYGLCPTGIGLRQRRAVVTATELGVVDEQLDNVDYPLGEAAISLDAAAIDALKLVPLLPELRVLDAQGQPLSEFARGWQTVEYGPLQMELILPKDLDPTQVGVLVDGRSLASELSRQSSFWTPENGTLRRIINWQCPPVGRHTFQLVLHTSTGRWTSKAIHVDIRPPSKPAIIAVGQGLSAPEPWTNGAIFQLLEDALIVQFEMPANTLGMRLHVDGFREIQGDKTAECCYRFDLSRELTVGRHALRFRRMVGSNCSMTSPLSNPLWVQYEPLSRLTTIDNTRAQSRYQILSVLRSESHSLHQGLINQVTRELRAPLAHVIPVQVDPNSELHPQRSPSTPIDPMGLQPSTAPIPAGTGVPPTPSPAPPRPGSDHDHTSNLDSNASRFVTHQVPAQHAQELALVPPTTKIQTIRTVAATPELEIAAALRALSTRRADELKGMEQILNDAATAWQDDKPASHVIFNAPAYFRRTGFGPLMQEDASTGLVLLEGMELTTYDNGTWKLNIPYQQPTVPTKLLLQIQVKASDQWMPLTVPPICFEADDLCSQDGPPCSQTQAKQRTVQGYSPILKREAGYFTEVRRRGSAQFGHGWNGLFDD